MAIVAIAACGNDDDITDPPDDNELSCVDPSSAGGSVTCSVTLPAEAAVKITLTSSQTCEAVGDAFVVTAPTAVTVTSDACFEPVLPKESDLGTLAANTQLAMQFTPGTITPGGPGTEQPGVAKAQVSGEYPQWTISLEDASGAFSNDPDDYDDVVVTVTATPTGQ